MASLLRLSLRSEPLELAAAVRRAAASGTDRLYVLLRGDWQREHAQSRLSSLYFSLSSSHPHLDLRVLLPPAPIAGAEGTQLGLVHPPELDTLLGFCPEDGDDLGALNAQRSSAGLGVLHFRVLSTETLQEPAHDARLAVGPTSSFIECECMIAAGETKRQRLDADTGKPVQAPEAEWDNVCVGGTFDRLHAGHKFLLSMAALVCSQSLTIGVSDASLLSRKRGRRMVQPVALRAAKVFDFLQSVRPEIKLELFTLSDELGPSAYDPKLQAMIVSAETVGGVALANAARAKVDLPPLEAVVVGLIKEGKSPATSLASNLDAVVGTLSRDEITAAKVSSTTARRLLYGLPIDGAYEWCGRRAHWAQGAMPPPCLDSQLEPYVAGMAASPTMGALKAYVVAIVAARLNKAVSREREANSRSQSSQADASQQILSQGANAVKRLILAIQRHTASVVVRCPISATSTLRPAELERQISQAFESGMALSSLTATSVPEVGEHVRATPLVFVYVDEDAEAGQTMEAQSLPASRVRSREMLGASMAPTESGGMLLPLIDEVWYVDEPDPRQIEASPQGVDAQHAKHSPGYLDFDALEEDVDVFFSLEWESDDLQRQVDSAWPLLQERVASAPLACAPPDSLLYEWRQVCHEAGVPAPAQASWWRRLRKAYSSPTRYYHTLEHLHAMFKWLRPLRANVNSWVDISFSVFFHDAVYEANAQRPGANERDSAALWRQFASECLTAGEGRDSTWHGTNASAPTMEGRVDRVAAYIERTANHLVGEADGDLAMFLDADLEVLSRSQAKYSTYAQQVRLEYSHVPHPVYLQARANILRGFERSPQLYFTRHARVAGMEEKARRNLRDEVRRLEGSGRAA